MDRKDEGEEDDDEEEQAHERPVLLDLRRGRLDDRPPGVEPASLVLGTREA